MRRLLLVALLPAFAWAHGGQPRVTSISFPAQYPNTVWAVTDSQGLYVRFPDGGFRWLCEDALVPEGGVTAVAPVGGGDRWVLTTDLGIFHTDDGGCGFERAGPPLDVHTGIAASAHPARRDELVVATDSFGELNDVFFSDDGGRTWSAAGLALPTRIRALRRDGDTVFIAHGTGAARSDDGGRRFTPIKLGPQAVEPRPLEFRLLAAVNGLLFAALERLPDTLLMRSEDGGGSWTVVAEIADTPLDLAFDDEGREGLLLTAFEGALRTEDGGRTWDAEALPVDSLEAIEQGPGGRLWGSSNVFFGGPWAVASSDDMGRTWQVALPAYERIARRWDCAADRQTTACCQHLCPGVPADGTCRDQAEAPGPTCDLFDPPDGGIEPDLGVDAEVDAAVAGDAAPAMDALAEADSSVERDARPTPDAGRVDVDVGTPPDATRDIEPDAAAMTRRREGGCDTTPDAPLLLLLLAGRRRR